MNRNQLIEEIAADKHFNRFTTRTFLKKLVRHTLDKMVCHLKSGEKLTISGFGTFTPVLVSQRKFRNPKTNTCQIVKAHPRVKFTASKRLKVTKFYEEDEP